jgi:hypothetical protein
VSFTDCHFTACKGKAGEEANGVEVRGEDTSPSFSRCVFSGCDSGLAVTAGKVIVTNSKFEDNDFGLVVSDNAQCAITDCSFARNTHGVNVQTSSAAFAGCSFVAHRRVAFWADMGSEGTVERSTITDSEQIGILIEGKADNKATEFKFTGCELRGTTGAGIGVKEDGIARLISCTITRTSAANVDVQSRGRAFLDQCNLSESLLGVGLKLKDEGSKVEATKCVISKQKQSAVLLEAGA